jgi:uncharacterized membrane protein
MDMTYKEKSVAGTLIVVLITNFYYFQRVWELYFTGEPRLSDLVPLVIGVIILTIVLEIAYEILISGSHKEDQVENDERDSAFERRGERISGYVLAAGVYTCIGYIFFNDLFDQLDSSAVFVAVNLLIFFLSLSEFTKGAIQLVSYRRGF